jgi:hypothetical protein
MKALVLFIINFLLVVILFNSSDDQFFASSWKGARRLAKLVTPTQAALSLVTQPKYLRYLSIMNRSRFCRVILESDFILAA